LTPSKEERSEPGRSLDGDDIRHDLRNIESVVGLSDLVLKDTKNKEDDTRFNNSLRDVIERFRKLLLRLSGNTGHRPLSDDGAAIQTLIDEYIRHQKSHSQGGLSRSRSRITHISWTDALRGAGAVLGRFRGAWATPHALASAAEHCRGEASSLESGRDAYVQREGPCGGGAAADLLNAEATDSDDGQSSDARVRSTPT